MTEAPNLLLNMEKLTFPSGLVGIPEWKNFSLHQTVDTVPIALLQCLDEPRVSFIVSNPVNWFATYRFDISDDDMKLIGAGSVDNLVILTIINVEANPFAISLTDVARSYPQIPDLSSRAVSPGASAPTPAIPT